MTKNNITAIETRIAGTTFNNRHGYICYVSKYPNTKLTLHREPKNAHDNNAIKVMAHTNTKHLDLGYIPKTVAAKLAPIMDGGNFVAVKLKKVIGRRGGNYGAVINLYY